MSTLTVPKREMRSDAMSQNIAHTRGIRPTDATGLFWAFMMLVLAWLFSLTPKSNEWRILPMLGVPFALAYQVWVWRRDAIILREAEAWRQLHFPNAQPRQLLRFLVTLSHICEHKASDFHPGLSLDALNSDIHNLELFATLSDSEKARWHRHWLVWVFSSAGLTGVNVEHLPTGTLGNLITAVFLSEGADSPGPRSHDL